MSRYKRISRYNNKRRALREAKTPEANKALKEMSTFVIPKRQVSLGDYYTTKTGRRKHKARGKDSGQKVNHGLKYTKSVTCGHLEARVIV